MKISDESVDELNKAFSFYMHHNVGPLNPENARRLVARWNYCEALKMSTERIEECTAEALERGVGP